MSDGMKIGIIGFGNMGKALALALKRGGNFYLFAYDCDRKKTQAVKGLCISKNIEELIKNADVVVLSVKPQDIKNLLREIKKYLAEKKPLFISIAAGISTQLLQKYLGEIKIIRAMPNLAAKVEESISFVSKGKLASKKDLDAAAKILKAVGEVIAIQEKYLDKATAVSGSGPGYIFYFMNALYEGALELGFSKKNAKKMAEQIFWGSAKLAKESKEDFKLLIKGVTSKGGTTEAALEVFNERGLEKIIKEGVKAACQRASEITKQQD